MASKTVELAFAGAAVAGAAVGASVLGGAAGFLVAGYGMGFTTCTCDYEIFCSKMLARPGFFVYAGLAGVVSIITSDDEESATKAGVYYSAGYLIGGAWGFDFGEGALFVF